MAYEEIRHDVRDGVAWIRLNRPDKLNALTGRMAEEVLDAVGRVAEDRAVRCLVLTGEGRGFCAGQDLGEFSAGGSAPPDIAEHLRTGYNRTIRALVELPKPVVGGVNGVAAGAGLSLALACDVRLASDAATFLQAFVKIGLIPDSGGTWLLPRAVGYGRALELSITGRRVEADEAARIGLVHRVVPARSFDDELGGLAASFAEAPTRAIGATKRLLSAAEGSTLAETLEREAVAQAEMAASPDFAEGVQAFLDKRPARFTGR